MSGFMFMVQYDGTEEHYLADSIANSSFGSLVMFRPVLPTRQVFKIDHLTCGERPDEYLPTLPFLCLFPVFFPPSLTCEQYVFLFEVLLETQR